MVLQSRRLPRTLLNFSSRRLAKNRCCQPSISALAINYRQIHNEAINTKLRSPTSKDILHFQSILSQPDRSVLIQRQDDISKYNQDWTGHYIGNSSVVLRPKSTQEVSSILRYCHDNFIGVVPQGGNTGLCGGATPMYDEIILSMERMNTIRGFTDEHSGILTSDAGVILENLHVYANDHGHLFPLDLGSKGTCQIGGNVSTNAGGSHYYRFGSLHATVVGLEVVLADGRVLHLNMSDNGNEEQRLGSSNRSGIHRKDNTGYDMKHLFIGGEGTLGIITKVAIACPTLPISKNASLLVVNSYDDVLKILMYAKEELGETLSAVELMDSNTLQLVQEHGFSIEDSASRLLQSMLKPEDISVQGAELSTTPSSLFVLVESQGSDIEADTSKMDSFITRLFDSGVIQNGSVAQDSKKIYEMWRIREACNPSVASHGATYKFDVSLPINEYMDVSYEVEKKLKAESLDVVVCVWGHIADGNAHINVVTPGQRKKDANLSKKIETIVYDSVIKRRGSISAEHGLGQAKNDYLGKIKEKDVLDIMDQLKRTFDPHGILNPNKYLRSKA